MLLVLALVVALGGIVAGWIAAHPQQVLAVFLRLRALPIAATLREKAKRPIAFSF